MASSFWHKLKKPILALAPMANVTDAAFRQIIAKNGKPDVIWTEFVSCDGLLSAGREKLLPDLWFTEAERPIVAQFFGAKPEMFYECARLTEELGFDGIDINMGCPDKGVEKQGAGAALLKNPELAQKIIKETQRGAGKLPVSVKTRIGYSKNTLREWLPALLETELAAITFHLRTRNEMSSVPAHWELMPEIMERVKAYDDSKNRTLILGNGDCETPTEARELCQKYGMDGVMIGRGIFGNPWLFNESQKTVSLREKLETMIVHTKLFCELYQIDPEIGHQGRASPSSNIESVAGRGLKDFSVMKKHYKAYASGFDGAKELRVRLMETKDVSEVEAVTLAWFAENS